MKTKWYVRLQCWLGLHPYRCIFPHPEPADGKHSLCVACGRQL